MSQASRLTGVGLTFHEAMVGAVGARLLSFEVSIRIPDLARFFDDPEHGAELTGTATSPDLGGTLSVRDGSFQLFAADAASGFRQLRYSFHFTAGDGGTYFLYGHKDIHDDPGLDVVKDLACLYTSVYRGETDAAPLYGSGELRFSLTDLPALLASFRVQGATDWTQDLAARFAFTSFVWGQVRDEYLENERGTLPRDRWCSGGAAEEPCFRAEVTPVC